MGSTKRKLQKTYPIRADSAVTISKEISSLLDWKPGDMMEYEVDFKENTLTLRKKADDGRS